MILIVASCLRIAISRWLHIRSRLDRGMPHNANAQREGGISCLAVTAWQKTVLSVRMHAIAELFLVYCPLFEGSRDGVLFKIYENLSILAVSIHCKAYPAFGEIPLNNKIWMSWCILAEFDQTWLSQF